jgi:hypothetical protein
MEDDCCFICAENCTDSYFYLINLASKKYKTKFTTLIGDLINTEYELRVSERNKVCSKCCVLLEKFDEMQQETKTIKSVLSRQIANTYDIETNEPQIFIDHSKLFIKLNSSASISDIKYSCKMCRFVTNKIDNVNTHCMYHKIITDSKIQTNEIIKDLNPASKRNNPIGREIRINPELVKSTQVNQNSDLKKAEVHLENETHDEKESGLEISEYDEKTLETKIDLDLLEDEAYDSNLKNNKCMMNTCEEEFNFVCQYVKHLKIKHKSSLNHIFAVVRANIKRPNKLDNLMCPYCFTKTPNIDLLEEHVLHHEEAAKSKLFTERINLFCNDLIKIASFQDEAFRNGSAKKIVCKYCTKLYYQQKLYNNHLATSHNCCFICYGTYEDKKMLRDHIKGHIR